MAYDSMKDMGRLIRMILFPLFIAGFLISLLSACAIPNGSASNPSTPSETADIPLTTENFGGNLHYQNLVLPIGGQIYFTSASGLLSKASPDGSHAQVLADHPGSNLISDGTTLFYTDIQQDGSLSKVGLNGGNQVRIGNTPLKYLISANSRLYAIETASGKAISLKTDGTNRVLLTDEKAASMLLSDGQLYISGLEGSAGLIRYDLQSGETEYLIQKRISSPNILEGWLYFADPMDGYHLRAWSLDEKTDWLISRLSVEKPFIVSQGYLYFINSAEQNRLYRIPVNGRQNLERLQPDLIVDDAVGLFAVCGNQIYYQRPDNQRIYRIPAAGGKAIRIT